MAAIIYNRGNVVRVDGAVYAELARRAKKHGSINRALHKLLKIPWEEGGYQQKVVFDDEAPSTGRKKVKVRGKKRGKGGMPNLSKMEGKDRRTIKKWADWDEDGKPTKHEEE